MAEQSKIAWTDSTANFWSGCTKVSAGCQHCYAEEMSNRFLPLVKGNRPTLGKWGKGAPRQLHESAFKLAGRLNRIPMVCDRCGYSTYEQLKPGEAFHHRSEDQTQGGEKLCDGPFHRRRIFSLSLGDWLDPEVPIEWLARMLDTIRQCRDVDWLLCTKRPENFASRLLGVYAKGDYMVQQFANSWRIGVSIPRNIVVLASVENQEQADKRIPELLRIPAWRRGLSCEPLLGEVKLHQALAVYEHSGLPCCVGKTGWHPNACGIESQSLKPQLDWVIIGGESGNKARPCNVDWVRSLKDQCKAAEVPVFCKQVGSNPIWGHDDFPNIKDKKGGDWNEWPEDLKIREFYKP